MELYDVTVWDKSLSEKPDEWTMESPPVRVKATDSYEAARQVAKRAGITELKGIPRPPENLTGMFFESPGLDLVFQSEDTGIIKPKRVSFY